MGILVIHISVIYEIAAEKVNTANYPTLKNIDQFHTIIEAGILQMRIILLTMLTMIAFAANSVLCRLALGGEMIDAAGFTSVRLLAGSLVLLAILKFRRNNKHTSVKGSWISALMLFTYAGTFSFAYISLNTGTGALILFGAVQITMIIMSLISGHRLRTGEWLGMSIAFAGFVYLVLPGVHAPSPVGFILMASAGIAWGVYTMNGRKSGNPVSDTAYNFLRTVPLVIILILLSSNNIHLTQQGFLLALISGAVTSGLGYVIWYMALGGLTATVAAVVQLSVPVIAALGGILFVSEQLTLRFTLATLMILGGIFIVIMARGVPRLKSQN